MAPAGVMPVDPVAIAAGYVRLAAERATDIARDLEPQLRAVEAAAAQIDRTSRLVLNHGDLQAANLLGPLPVLVDWEYSQCADPTWDVACLLDYYPELQPRRDAVLEACGLDPVRDGQILSLQQALFARLNQLWSLAQPAAG
jgi:thiamine kinase-like enzyme